MGREWKGNEGRWIREGNERENNIRKWRGWKLCHEPTDFLLPARPIFHVSFSQPFPSLRFPSLISPSRPFPSHHTLPITFLSHPSPTYPFPSRPILHLSQSSFPFSLFLNCILRSTVSPIFTIFIPFQTFTLYVSFIDTEFIPYAISLLIMYPFSSRIYS